MECSRCRELAGVLGENRRVLNMVSNWKGIALKVWVMLRLVVEGLSGR